MEDSLLSWNLQWKCHEVGKKMYRALKIKDREWYPGGKEQSMQRCRGKKIMSILIAMKKKNIFENISNPLNTKPQ